MLRSKEGPSAEAQTLWPASASEDRRPRNLWAWLT